MLRASQGDSYSELTDRRKTALTPVTRPSRAVSREFVPGGTDVEIHWEGKMYIHVNPLRQCGKRYGAVGRRALVLCR